MGELLNDLKRTESSLWLHGTHETFNVKIKTKFRTLVFLKAFLGTPKPDIEDQLLF